MEPFVVPSGSMLPNLWVNDYILVSKWNVGLKIPGTRIWVWGPDLPDRGRMVVFRSPIYNKFFVKRLIGWPGDKIQMLGNQVIQINDMEVQKVFYEGEISEERRKTILKSSKVQNSENLRVYQEIYTQNSKTQVYKTMYLESDEEKQLKTYEVPAGHLFFLGDHRSRSHDSRKWGFVKVEDIVGPVNRILWNCDQKNGTVSFCDPSKIRWDRVFISTQNL